MTRLRNLNHSLFYIAGMEDEVQLQHHPGAVQPDPEGPVPDIEGSASLHVNAVPKVGEHAAEVSFIPTCQGGSSARSAPCAEHVAEAVSCPQRVAMSVACCRSWRVVAGCSVLG